MILMIIISILPEISINIKYKFKKFKSYLIILLAQIIRSLTTAHLAYNEFKAKSKVLKFFCDFSSVTSMTMMSPSGVRKAESIRLNMPWRL